MSKVFYTGKVTDGCKLILTPVQKGVSSLILIDPYIENGTVKGKGGCVPENCIVGATAADLIEQVCQCKNSVTLVDGNGDPVVQQQEKDFEFITLCNDNGRETAFTMECIAEGEYLFTGDNGFTHTGTLATMSSEAGYYPCAGDKKTYEGERCFYPTNQENLPENKRDYISYDAWLSANNTWCYYPIGSDPTEENLISENILNTLTMSYDPRKRGQLVEESPVVVTPQPLKGTLTICVDDADVDAIPALLGSAPVTDFIAALPALPAGLAYGVTTANFHKVVGGKGCTVDCDVSGATDVPILSDANTQGTFTTPFDPNNNIKPDGETGIIGKPLSTFLFVAEDGTCTPCYDVAGELTAGDVLLNNGSVGGAFDVTLCFGCFGTPAK